jgi:hypothetical protein
MAVLDPDITGHASIIGGRHLAHVEGRQAVLAQFVQRFGPGAGRTLHPSTIEDHPALLVLDRGRLYGIIVLHVTDGIVRSIRSYLRPN